MRLAKSILFAGLSFALVTGQVLAQEGAKPRESESGPKEKPASVVPKPDLGTAPLQTPSNLLRPVSPSLDRESGKPKPPKRSERIEYLDRPEKPERPEKPGKPTRLSLEDEIQSLIDQFKNTRDEFLDKDKELRRILRESAQTERERIRSLIAENLQTFLDDQKQAREEINQRITELKDSLKDHREVIDAAKEEAKVKARER